MAWKLYQLGRWCFRHRGRVVAGWLALLVLGGVGAATLSGQTNDTFELPSTESSQAFDLIKERTPQAATDGAIARVVVQAPEGEQVTSPATQEVVTTALEELTTGHVASVADPFTTGTVSPDGRTAYAVVSYDRPAVELTAADEDAMHDAVADPRGRRPDRRRGRRRLRRAGHRRGRGRGHRDPGGPRGPGHHVRLAGRRRPAAADRDHRRQHRHPRRHHPDRVPRAVLHHAGAGHHARPRRRDRLRAVRDVALPPRGVRRARARGGRRPRHRHRRLGRGLRRPHRRHRPRRAVHHRHHLPDPDGPGGRRHRRRRGRDRAHPAAGPAGLRGPARHHRHAARAEEPRPRGRRRAHQRPPLGRPRDPLPGAGAGRRAGRRRGHRPPARLDGARPARRRVGAGRHGPSSGLRPDRRELRGGRQRPAHRRGRHAGRRRPGCRGRCRGGHRRRGAGRRRRRHPAGRGPERRASR